MSRPSPGCVAALVCALIAPSTVLAQSRASMRAGVLESGSHELAYVEWPGSGTPLVLLHGLGGNALWWAELAAAVTGRHVIAVDLPGHGQSPRTDDWSLSAVAESIATAVDKRWPGAHVWGGHSWGGKLALLAGRKSRFEMKGLMLIDPVPIGEAHIESYTALADYLFAGELKTWRTVVEATADIRTLPAYQRWNSAMEAAFRRGVRVDVSGAVRSVLTRETAVDILKTIYETNIASYVAEVAAPILLVTAEESRQFQTQNVHLLSRATHEILPGNHWLHVTSVDALGPIVRRWLSVVP